MEARAVEAAMSSGQLSLSYSAMGEVTPPAETSQLAEAGTVGRFFRSTGTGVTRQSRLGLAAPGTSRVASTAATTAATVRSR